MRWIFIFLYWLITWILKYIINIFEFIWYLDFNNFSYYGTHFLYLNYLRNIEPELSVVNTSDGLNFIERFVFWCIKNEKENKR